VLLFFILYTGRLGSKPILYTDTLGLESILYSGKLGLILYSLVSRSRIGSLFFIETGSESALYCPKALYTAFSLVQNFFAQYHSLASSNTISSQVVIPFSGKFYYRFLASLKF
jgi:hypothetical protein